MQFYLCCAFCVSLINFVILERIRNHNFITRISLINRLKEGIANNNYRVSTNAVICNDRLDWPIIGIAITITQMRAMLIFHVFV